MPPDSTPDVISKAIVDNYAETWIDSIASIDEPKDLFDSKVKYFLTGVPVMMLNSLFDGDFTTKSEVEEVVGYFRKRSIPMMWWVGPEGIKNGIDKHLQDINLELAQMKVPGMAADVRQINVEDLRRRIGLPNIEIKRTSPSDSGVYSSILNQGFEISEEASSRMEDFNKIRLNYSQASHFLASFKDQPGSISSVYFGAGVAGIYEVATLRELRGKGLASAVVAKCMLDAIEKGYNYIILHSSAMGHELYKKLGFKDYFIFKRFLLR